MKIFCLLLIGLILICPDVFGQNTTAKSAVSTTSATINNVNAPTTNVVPPSQAVMNPQTPPMATNTVGHESVPTAKPAQTPQAAAPQPTAAAAPKMDGQTPSDRKWRIGIGFGYMLATQNVQFDNATYITGGSTINGTASLNYGSTYVVDLEGRYLPSDSWGFIGGLNYEGQREFSSGTLQGGGYDVDLIGGAGASKVQFITAYANAAYRWGTFYVPFGVNFSSAAFTPGSGSSGTYSVSGGVGAELGIGFMVSPSFAVEAYSWVTSMSLNTIAPGASLNYGSAYFQSDVLVLKYIF